MLVDTGSDQLILDAEAAESFGVRPSQRGLRYIRFTKLQGESLPVGFVQNISAGSMSFGSSLVTLRKSSHADAANAAFDGVLGLDILFRHNALIIAARNLSSSKSIKLGGSILIRLLLPKNSRAFRYNGRTPAR
jgi:hypothetical protein